MSNLENFDKEIFDLTNKELQRQCDIGNDCK